MFDVGPVLRALLFVSSVSASLYVRPVVGFAVEGELGRVFAPGDGDVLSCVKQWSLDPPAIVLFNETTKKCTAMEKVYGTSDDRNAERAYLLTRSDANQCLEDTVEDVKMIYSCRPDWHQISLDNSVACYQPMSRGVYREYEIAGEGHSFLRACKGIYPFADAASLHSRQEESLIVKTFESVNWKWYYFYGYKIALRLLDAADPTIVENWFWTDGSPMDYNPSLDKVELESYCNKFNCTHAALYWQDNGANISISGADNNSRDLLCKYTLRKN